MLDSGDVQDVLLRVRAELGKGFVLRNEAQTRRSIVEPLLRVLFGFDPADSGQVRIEYTDQSTDKVQSIDYLLLADGRAVLVEAKAAGRVLSDREEAQLYRYYRTVRVEGFRVVAGVLTNGCEWRLFRDFGNGGWEPYHVFDVRENMFLSAVDRVHLAALWRTNLRGSLVDAAVGLQGSVSSAVEAFAGVEGLSSSDVGDFVAEVVEPVLVGKVGVTEPVPKSKKKPSAPAPKLREVADVDPKVPVKQATPKVKKGGKRRAPPTPLSGFSLFGESYRVSTWTGLWLKVVEEVWVRHPDREVFLRHPKFRVSGEEFAPSDEAVAVDVAGSELRTPRSFSAANTRKYVNRLLKLFGYDPGEVFQVFP